MSTENNTEPLRMPTWEGYVTESDITNNVPINPTLGDVNKILNDNRFVPPYPYLSFNQP
jgi:hypothetical protein